MPDPTIEQLRGSEDITPTWIDNHCHVDESDVALGVLDDAVAAGVIGFVCVGTDMAGSRRALELSRSHPRIWATAGVHPHDAKDGIQGLRELFVDATGRGDRLVAVGECGLDYHYDHSPREVQRQVFAKQIALANELDLPLVIHTRSAWDDTFEILDSESTPRRTVFHCFTGGPAEAKGALERGGMLSISGIVTFGSADDVREAVRATPLDHLMVETDSPYLAPVPHRGRRNVPANVAVVGEAVAEVLELPVGDVAVATTANAVKFYGLGIGIGDFA